MKKISASDNDGKQDWFSVPVPPSAGTKLQVTGLSPATDYQFSILSHNKMGTGPFSEIAAARTLGQYRCTVCPLTLMHETEKNPEEYSDPLSSEANKPLIKCCICLYSFY